MFLFSFHKIAWASFLWGTYLCFAVLFIFYTHSWSEQRKKGNDCVGTYYMKINRDDRARSQRQCEREPLLYLRFKCSITYHSFLHSSASVSFILLFSFSLSVCGRHDGPPIQLACVMPFILTKCKAKSMATTVARTICVSVRSNCYSTRFNNATKEKK